MNPKQFAASLNELADFSEANGHYSTATKLRLAAHAAANSQVHAAFAILGWSQ